MIYLKSTESVAINDGQSDRRVDSARRRFLGAGSAALAAGSLPLGAVASMAPDPGASGLAQGAMARVIDDHGRLSPHIQRTSPGNQPVTFSLLNWHCPEDQRPMAMELTVTPQITTAMSRQPVPVQFWSYRQAPVECQSSANSLCVRPGATRVMLARRQNAMDSMSPRWGLDVTSLGDQSATWVIADLGQSRFTQPNWATLQLRQEDGRWLLSDGDAPVTGIEFMVVQVSPVSGLSGEENDHV